MRFDWRFRMVSAPWEGFRVRKWRGGLSRSWCLSGEDSTSPPPNRDAAGGNLDDTVADQLDVDAMIARYQARAEAVRNRSLPPVAGEERRRFIKQAEEDYLDYSLVGAAKWSVEEGHLVLRIPLGGGG